MKKMIATLTALVLLLTLAAGWASAEDWTDYTCTEDSFSIRVPAGADVAYEEGNGLTIYTKAAGKIPYAIVHRRPADKKLSNPGNYLGNVYREYLEDKYGSDYMGMSDLGMWEAGGKELPGAKYRYRVGEYTVVLVKLLDIRDAADVEYTVKYVEGDESSIMPAVNEAVRTYRETDSPAASGRTEKPQTRKAAVEPADVSGIKPDTQNGSYWVRVMNEHKINNGGYFTADLYIPDVYSLQDINSLREGDRIRMDGKEWTVAALMPEENGLRELRVKEEFDGYFAFQTAGDNTCILVINDWVASSYIGRETIMLPLPNSFTYVESELSGENTVYDADSFIDLLVKEGTDRLTRYNTVIGFSDGMPAYILHADYPEGPDPNSEPGWAGE